MRKSIAKLLIAMMVIMTIIPTANFSFAETTGTQPTVPTESQTEGTEETQASQESEITTESTESELSTEPTDRETNDSEEQQVTEEMNFLYIESKELTTPGTQNIVVSWDESMDNITDMQLMYTTPNGNTASIKEAKRTDKSVLFTKEFTTSEVGTYTVKGVKYFVDGEENFFEFNDVEIDATFKVIKTDVAASDDTIVSVDVENNGTVDKKEVTSDIKVAIASADAEVAQKSRTAKSGNVVVVLDPGHGGNDPGAVRNGLREKDLNLKIAKYCKEELSQYGGVSVYMTRETDTGVGANDTLQDRVDVGKKYGADILVSLHINAGGGKGAEIYYPNNNYNASAGAIGKGAASEIQKELVKLGLTDRGIKIKNSQDNTQYPNGSLADYYGMIRRSKLAGFAGIIVEHAFIDNASDAAFLSSEANLKKLGVADATGIAKYFGLSKGQWIQDESGWRYQNADGSYKINEWLPYNNKRYYFDDKGIMVVGLQKVGDKKYYFDSTGAMQTGWQSVNSTWYYFASNGQAVKGWLKSGSRWYYLNSECKMVTGLKTINNQKYYFNSSGAMQTGWQKSNSTWYYFSRSGEAIKGWLKSGSHWYYLNSECKMVTGLETINNQKYYFNSNGAMQTGWQKINSTWYYFNNSGSAVKGWLKQGGYWYYLNSECKMVTGLETINNQKYYFNSSGAMQTGWQKSNSTWYYFSRGGEAIKGWLKSGSHWYYLNSECKMVTGLETINNQKYYFNSSGAMQTGWQKINSTWYYFNSSGSAVKGWLKQGGYWYYLNSDYKMVTGEYSVDGKMYYFNNSGALMAGYPITGRSNVTAYELANCYTKYSPIKFPTYYKMGLTEFCQIYVQEAKVENINVEVAFCQAMKETGWLKYGNDVKIEQFNFAGIGATGGGKAGATFKDVRTGVRAQIQHLKAYANDAALNNACVDPRFKYVKRGSAPYVEWLGAGKNPNGIGWAPSATYGVEIVKMMNQL